MGWNHHLDLVDFYGFHVGKYASPMDPSWEIFVVKPTGGF